MPPVTLDVQPLEATFGAMVTGVRLADMDQATVRTLHEVWLEYALLIFPGQHLSTAQQDDVARCFGALEFPATALTNIGRDGALMDASHDLIKSLQGNEGWHHDSTFMPVQAKGAVFSAEIIPTDGGATEFADMRAAYEALDDQTREIIAPLAAYHSRRYSLARAGLVVDETAPARDRLYGLHDHDPPLRPLVKRHPETGRPNLVIGQHAYGIPGLSDEASVALLDRLGDEACQPPRVHRHEWAGGDTLLWDNRRLMHRATPHDPHQPRRMWHTRIAGADTERGINPV